MNARHIAHSVIGACSLLIAFQLNVSSFAEETSETSRWDRFRGKNGDGVLKQTLFSLPVDQSKFSKIDLPGNGNGSPALVDDRAYLIAANPEDATRHVVCVDLKQGEIAWQRTYNSQTHSLHKFSSYASTTPCVDEERVYVAWAEPNHLFVRAFTLDGQEVWTRDLGRYVSQHGFGTSPIIEDGKVILLNSQDAQELPPGVEPGTDTMLALDSKTGKTVWETPLPPTRVCYGVPRIRRTKDAKELLCCTTGLGMFALDFNTGKLLWNHECFTQRVCSSPVLIDNHILVGAHGSGGGKDNRLIAYDIDLKKELYRIDRASPYVPTSVSDGANLFLWSDNGIVTCVDALNGKVHWSERIGGNFSGSPIIIGNQLVNASHDGVVTLLAASNKFEKLGSLDTKQTIRSTIAASDKYILLRTDDQLWIASQPSSFK